METKKVWDERKREEIAKTLVATGKQHGVMLLPFTWLGTLVTQVSPPLNVTDSEISNILEALEASIKEVERVHM